MVNELRYTAKNVQAAIARGLEDLKAKRQEVKVEVIQSESSGFLGFFKKEAVVELKLLEPTSFGDTRTEETTTTVESEKSELHVSETLPPTMEEIRLSKRKQREAQLQDALLLVGDYLAEVTQKMGIKTEIDLEVSRSEAKYTFRTNQAGFLIGKRGKILNALQALAQDYLEQEVRTHLRIMLNVGDYRQHRQETLTYLAQNTAHEALYRNQAISLDPMPAFERKIIHAALAKNQEVKTNSYGKEPHRYVTIAPCKE